uniref:Saposin B-type domain-containing protein n=1 Tax=Timema shepardi TaxID=629360 RepID=A0A7R9ATZ4_TIMSH|nr:unnamed protein product [Timema shepardi]
MTKIVKIFILLSVLFLSEKKVEGRGINGGISCAACTIVSGISGQLAVLHNETFFNESLRLCQMLPGALRAYCDSIVQTLEPIFTDSELMKTFTPDIFCYAIGICYAEKSFCYLFPKPPGNFYLNIQDFKMAAHVAYKQRNSSLVDVNEKLASFKFDICKLPGFSVICDTFNKSYTTLQPSVDFDGDYFSIYEAARGSHWRGRDCADWNDNIYPGRLPVSEDIHKDSNCNGIFGTNPDTGEAYETELCNGTVSRGVIYLGDSVGAHFHMPEAWFNPRLISSVAWSLGLSMPMSGIEPRTLNSVERQATNLTCSLALLVSSDQGHTDSIYWKLRSRNRCNHRDYQNLSQNGASSEDLPRYLKTVSRNQTTDKPALVFYGMFGNDVCNRFPDTTSKMTTPDMFRKNVVQVLESLEAILPAGSHVVLIGLVDGGLIYPVMADRLHPIAHLGYISSLYNVPGQVGNNVYYRDVYNWFNCMEIGPCVGWMNTNATLRKITSRAAQKLSSVLQDIVAEEKFRSFDLNYLDNPFHEVIYRWQQRGGPAWELIDPVDSLHPAQDAQPLIANILWEHINEKFPHVLGDVNPNNDEIQQVFGDQQGH